MPRKHILYSGRVQGVGFRYHATVLARMFGCSGWVRNLDDGDVEMEIQGSRASIEVFLDKINQNDGYIRIDSMQVHDIPEEVDHGFFEHY